MEFRNSIILITIFFTMMLCACGDGASTVKETAKEVANKTTTEVKAAVGGTDASEVAETAKPAEAPADVVVKEEPKEEPKKEVKEKKKPKKKKKRAKMHFPEKVYDYGFIMQGDTVRHDFYFKNVGNDDLLIKSVTPSCGCTVPIYPREPIAPGEDGKISVMFKSAGKLGRQIPNISVLTNYQRRIKLELKGFVDAERAKAPKVIEAPEEVKQ